MYRPIHIIALFLSTATAALPMMGDDTCSCVLPVPLPSLAQRDLATITSAFSAVSSGLDALNAAVQNLNSATDLAPLQSASSSLLQSITAGTSSIKSSSGPLALQDAIKLQEVVSALEEKGQSLSTTLSNKKSKIQELGLCGIFRGQAGEIATVSQGLSDAVVGQVPEQARTVAQELARGFTDTLEETKRIFAEGACVDGAGSGDAAGSGQPGDSVGGSGNGTVVTAGAAAMTQARFNGGFFGLCAAGFILLVL